MSDLQRVSKATSLSESDERLRRIVLIVRQGLYGIADELGREFGMERPCKVCEQERRHTARTERPDKAV